MTIAIAIAEITVTILLVVRRFSLVIGVPSPILRVVSRGRTLGHPGRLSLCWGGRGGRSVSLGL